MTPLQDLVPVIQKTTLGTRKEVLMQMHARFLQAAEHLRDHGILPSSALAEYHKLGFRASDLSRSATEHTRAVLLLADILATVGHHPVAAMEPKGAVTA